MSHLETDQSMTRRAFWWRLAGIFCMTFAVALARPLLFGCRYPYPETLIAHAMGGAIGIFVVSGVFPLIWLAIRRFSLAHARQPLIAWTVLAILFLVAGSYTMHYQAGIGDNIC